MPPEMTLWKCFQLVFVFLLPRLVNSEEIVCYTYNFEEYLQCLWNTTSLKSEADVTVKWSLISGLWVSDWLDCPIRSQNSCRWDIERGDVDPSCVIRVKVSLFDLYHVVQCQEIVKPAPVENVTVLKVNSSCFALRWSLKKEYFSILYHQVYRITCLPLHGNGDLESSQKNFTWVVNDTQLDACGLVPYTKYIIRVTAKPSEGGLWSDTRTVNITTNKAVPGKAPTVHSNFFTRSLRANGAYSDVLIIWQELQSQRIYGSRLLYLVSICSHNSSEAHRDCAKETEFNFAQFQVPAQQEVTARIWSQNEIGTSKKSAVIRIPSEDELLIFPDVVVAVNSTHAILFLDVTNYHKDVKFSVYWCKKDIKNLQWLDKIMTTRTEISHNGNIYLKYGVSVEQGEQTSGIHWADCVIRGSELPRSPEVTLTYTEQNSVKVTWNIPLCNMKLLSSVIERYILYICNSPECAARKTLTLAPDLTSYIDKLSNDGTLCASLKIISISGKEFHSGRIQCLTENGSSMYIIAVIVVVVLLICSIIGLVKLTCIKCKSTNVEIQVPQIERNQSKKLLNNTPSTTDSDDKVYMRNSKDRPSDDCKIQLVDLAKVCDRGRNQYASETSSPTVPKGLSEVYDRKANQYTCATSSLTSLSEDPNRGSDRSTSDQSSIECCDSYIVMGEIDVDLFNDVD